MSSFSSYSGIATLRCKSDVDHAIKSIEDKVLVLRFGKENDSSCLLIDEILSKSAAPLARMAEIRFVEMSSVPIYTQYFDITLCPSTVFFFNGQHMKVDFGTQDHTKFVGCFPSKQEFIDLIEVIYRGAMRGKLMVTSPIDPQRVPKFDLIYKDI